MLGPFSAEYWLEETRISLTDSWLGVSTAAPPQAWLLTLTPSISKLLAVTRWPLALTGAWFSVWKMELFEPPGPDEFGQKAEFEGSASVTIVTKSGTNKFHGSVFEFNRNKAYAAKNFFATGAPKPPFNRNEFGFSLGGPVRQDKTFFFGNYEGLRERFPRVNTLSVATAAMRDGDFTGLPPIIDPLTNQPFPNNRVPANRLDPRAQALLKFVPLPNQAGAGPAGTLNNYVVNIANISDINRYGARLDHKLTRSFSICPTIRTSGTRRPTSRFQRRWEEFSGRATRARFSLD